MVDVTLTQGNDSVTIPLVASAGENLITRTVGKPELKYRKGGELQPRFQDQYSGIQGIQLVGQYTSDTAYQDAIDLCNFIKSQYDSPISFDVGLDEFDTPFNVAPAIGTDEALTVTYQPGRKNWVIIELSLSQIDRVRGSTNLSASTPTSGRNGPIEFEGVEMSTDIVVERTVGRPQDSEQRNTNSRRPVYIYKRGNALDSFEIGFQNLSDPVSVTQELYDLTSRPLGNSPLSLNFNGIFGMGEFNVVPNGSSAFRHIRAAGEQGVIQYPVLALRRVR